jgi:hypothetical protein|tara:strand:+ start:436 stop:624 length:189 start_codon:yes stop_codon:yes gene_type:complete
MYEEITKGNKNIMMGKIRPQIFLAILVLGVLAIFGVINEMPEISTGTIGGIIALGMKILEAE